MVSSSDQRTPEPASAEPPADEGLLRSEDWWSVWFGFILLAVAVFGLVQKIPKVGTWSASPLEALPFEVVGSLVLMLAGFGVLTAIGSAVMGRAAGKYLVGFVVVFVLAVLANLIGQQAALKTYGLGYALWSLVLGLLIANTVGTPGWLLAGARSEMFIKTGLVLLGAEILVNQILRLGGPGLIVAWIVTPTVIVFMWFFGTRVLRLGSRSLVIVVACATSVCGVSAAIASAAASRAKKEELTLVVGMTMIFTVAMMVGMPALCKVIGLDALVGGAWIGGTVDSTGAVVASGAILGEQAEKVAAVVKMIQNTLIGLIAFLIALYWVSVVERSPEGPRPSVMEIWYRFPKFVVGFLVASLLFSFVLTPLMGSESVGEVLRATKAMRGWWFALAFVSIGLESDFRKLAAQLAGGRPIVLYLVGQTFNVVLTLAAAYLAFGGVLFDPP